MSADNSKYNPYTPKTKVDLMWLLITVRLLAEEIIEKLNWVEKNTDDYENNYYAIRLRRALENVKFSEKLMNEALELKE